MSRPRVLWVTNEAPDRNLGGGSIRQAHLLEALADVTDVTLVLFGEPLCDERTRSALAHLVELPSLGVRSVRGPIGRRVHDLTAALFGNEPPDVAEYNEIRRELQRRWTEFGDHDIVMVEHVGLAPLVRLRQHETWLLTVHYVSSGTFDQLAAVNNGRRRWIFGRQARQAKRFECWALGAFDRAFSVSADDASLLPGSTTVIPNGVDLDRFVASSLPSEPRLVLIGTLGYRPNVDGVMWFVHDVLPLIRRHVPNVAVDLVGRLPTQEVLDLGHEPGVAVYADVPDVRDYLLRARVSIVPLRVGTGTRLKALESFAAYRPVVGTGIGLAGLGIVDGRHALIADDPDAFAAGVVQLLRDDDLAKMLVHNARSLVEAEYSWTTIGATFVDAVLKAADANRRRS